ncbi:MAG: permease prefix domain 2-containing transporter, partial [Gemmatimonadota bacterium]|nr:permease prefix domain 2-containing transporter [Gemmatimonadota bacterium]
MSPERPPRLAVFLFKLFVPAPERDALLGDLEEDFCVNVSSRGRFAARLIFWSEVFHAAPFRRRTNPDV